VRISLFHCQMANGTNKFLLLIISKNVGGVFFATFIGNTCILTHEMRIFFFCASSKRSGRMH